MDHAELANDLIVKLRELHKVKPYKNIIESMQGESPVLEYVANHDGYVLPGEIAREMDVSSARIAAILNRLDDKGLITRQVDTKNRRQRLVGTTQDGKKVAGEYKQTLLGDAAKILDLLGEHDTKEYVRITKRMIELPRDYDDY